MKGWSVLISIGLMLFFVSSNATGMEGRFGVGGNLGFRTFGDDSVSAAALAPVNLELDFDDSFIFGANATYFFNEAFSMEFGVGHVRDVDTELGLLGVSFDAGEFSSTPLLLTLRFHIPISDSSISPYIGAGVGYYLNSFDAEATVWGAGTDVDIDDAFGFHANAGVEVFFGQQKNMAITVDVKYAWIEPDFIISVPGLIPLEADVDIGGFTACAGIKYYFK